MEETQYIAHFGVDGRMQSAGDATAEGAMHGILRALELRSELQVEEITVAIQGLGSVGVSLAKRFLELGARVVGADVDSSKIALAQNIGVHYCAAVENIVYQLRCVSTVRDGWYHP